MTRDDDPTQPLPAAAGDAPKDAAATEPLVAPHVPIAQPATVEAATVAPASVAPRRDASKRVLIVGLTATAAALTAVVVLSTMPKGEPVPLESSTPSVSPTPSAPPETDVATDPAPAPPPVDPVPEPTPTVPAPEPTPTP